MSTIRVREDLPDQIVAAVTEGGSNKDALTEVLKFHGRDRVWVPVDHPMFVDGGAHVDLCMTCVGGPGVKRERLPYPCSTVRVIASALGVRTGLPSPDDF